MNRTSLFIALFCLLTSGLVVVAQNTTSMMFPNVNSSETAGNNMSVAETPTATVSTAALPPSDNSSSSSPSPTPTPSPSTTAAPTSDEGMRSSSSISASPTVAGSNSQETTMAAEIVKKRVLADTTYIPMVAAIVSGFGLLILLMILFFSMALVYRYLGKEDSTMIMKKPKKGGADAFYGGQEPQSAQYLVSSMSITSFGSSPSDARLESHLPNSPGVHYNRGFDVDHNPSGAGANGNGNGHEDGFKPIQIVAAEVNPRSSTTHV